MTPGLTTARNALSDPKSSPEVRRAALQIVAEARFPALTPPEEAVDRRGVWLDRAANVCLISAVIGVVALITYVITLPGAMK